jgi:Zn-dependent protease
VKWSFQLMRIAGIDVRVHATFFLLLAWFGTVYFLEGGYGAMVIGLSFIILLFACVVLHEFGHALAARAYGINTPDITLLPIGGIARLERMPDKPWQELVVALAGPAVNVVIAFGLYIVIGRFFGLGDLEELAEGRGNLLTQLLAINVILVVFNLLPAFPMDGGRVLRALLATRLSHARATRIAAAVGQTVAVLFGLLGLFGGNPFLLFIAVFVFFGARAEANFATFKETAEGTRVAPDGAGADKGHDGLRSRANRHAGARWRVAGGGFFPPPRRYDSCRHPGPGFALGSDGQDRSHGPRRFCRHHRRCLAFAGGRHHAAVGPSRVPGGQCRGTTRRHAEAGGCGARFRPGGVSRRVWGCHPGNGTI